MASRRIMRLMSVLDLQQRAVAHGVAQLLLPVLGDRAVGGADQDALHGVAQQAVLLHLGAGAEDVLGGGVVLVDADDGVGLVAGAGSGADARLDRLGRPDVDLRTIRDSADSAF
ncbi:hypothetical protein Stube_22280 [Streptomyces tubercidicus]|uniref:Uncharacterized protein n=1 Tax=Streptomyces tubercidicus TaxID=47759 RepID=A0A640UT83_9ACTN|nr:hypothetical protein Stube_22280 [Streptomyces tubercidicus]